MGYLLGLQTARQQRHNLDLALGQTRRTLDLPRGLPHCLQHRADRVGIEPPGAGLLAGGLRGTVGRKGLAVRARLGHRLVGRGLPLMFAVMDHVEIDSVPGQTVVRLAKRLAA